MIGEHIDYCLFGVLPTAVERDILIACAPTDEASGRKVTVQNVDTSYPVALFEPIRQGTRWDLPIDTSKLRWESYVKAGYHVRGASKGELDCNNLVSLLWCRGFYPISSTNRTDPRLVEQTSWRTVRSQFYSLLDAFLRSLISRMRAVGRWSV